MAESTKTYEELKQELDQVMSRLRHEDTSIDDAVQLHAQGKKLLEQLEVYLQKVSEAVESETK